MLARVLARLFRSVFLMRQAEARALSSAARALGLATSAEVRELEARIEQLEGRARAARAERG